MICADKAALNSIEGVKIYELAKNAENMDNLLLLIKESQETGEKGILFII